MLGTTVSGRLSGPRISSAILESLGAEKSLGVVASSSEVNGALQTQLHGKLGQDPGIRLGDAGFYLPTVQEVKVILAASSLERKAWTAERFDCDDFSYVLKGEMSLHSYAATDLRYGLCVGIVWGNFDWVNGYHAVNWFIAEDGVIRFIEPQSDAMYEASHCTGDISLLLV